MLLMMLLLLFLHHGGGARRHRGASTSLWHKMMMGGYMRGLLAFSRANHAALPLRFYGWYCSFGRQ